jgi:GNAT superfamily N-acetyltransferase
MCAALGTIQEQRNMFHVKQFTLRPACAKLKLRFGEGRQAQGEECHLVLSLSKGKQESSSRLEDPHHDKMKLGIRFARLPERAALIELQRRASLVWDEYHDALLANPDAIEIPVEQFGNCQVRAAWNGDRHFGFSAMAALDVEICELDGLFVEPAHWRQGIGGALIEDAVRLARRRKFHRMEVTANPRAEGFYTKQNFIKYAVTETRFGSASRVHRILNQ